MPISMIFWIIFLLWVLSGFWWGYARHENAPYANGALLAIMIFLIGWKTFGFIVQ